MTSAKDQALNKLFASLVKQGVGYLEIGKILESVEVVTDKVLTRQQK